MLWCDFCAKSCNTGTDHATSVISCVECGKVLCQDIFTEEVGFVKGQGECRVIRSYVRSIQSRYSDSYTRTLDKGIREICHFTVGLTGYRDESLVQPATCFYKLCIGAVFVQLCKLLSLQEHPTIQALVDPTLYMHRFTRRLMKDGDNVNVVLHTSFNIVASMKRDWMQTGRKPSGICGTALYISALSYALNYSRSDILKVVHICEAALTKRLIKFEGTTSSSLTS